MRPISIQRPAPMSPTPEHDYTQELLDFIHHSPSPWHAVETTRLALKAEGFKPLLETEAWTLDAEGRYFVTRGDSSLIAFTLGEDAASKEGFRIIGAHTDSPGLRVKPRGAFADDKHLRLGVDVYGGPILATWADRDLSLAGRLFFQTHQGLERRLLLIEKPLLRLPNLAIHLNRKVNEEGLRFNKQTELPLLLGEIDPGAPADQLFLRLLADAAQVEMGAIKSFELSLYDTQPGCFWGRQDAYFATRQIDNLSSCHAALKALTAASGTITRVIALFDHEEIGSESHKGADGSFLEDVLERIALAQGDSRLGFKQALSKSLLASADAAHAYHPNHPGCYEPLHGIRVNQGPALKVNVNQRYATDGQGEALFQTLCEAAGVPGQTYVHRGDLACGSTIGPMTAARLGIPTLDLGIPMWAMHSIRESAGTRDPLWLSQWLRAFLESDALLLQ